jgi:hypothetical protein
MNLLSIAVPAALLLLQPAAAKPAPQKPPAKATAAAPKTTPTPPTDLPVTITYKGKGTVDAAHKIIAWAFSDPDITSSSRPIGTEFASKNGDTVTFKDLSSPVYVFVVYDEKGGYDGVSGPPPHGLPCATYRKSAGTPPVAVKAGAPVKFTFDDSERWNK